MNFPKPKGWIIWCSCLAPAVLSTLVAQVLRTLDVKGLVRGDPALGIMPTAGLLTLLICIVGTLLPAIWLTNNNRKTVAFVIWLSLAGLNIVLSVPGCTAIFYK